MNIILLSGGSGQRLWPLSNEVRSKQFIKIFKTESEDYESMIQRVYAQIRRVDPDAFITVATSKAQVSAIHNQLGDSVGICVEPSRRDTFPAVALAAASFIDEKKMDPNEPIVVCPVDPYVNDDYFAMLKKMSDQARISSANLILLGIEPSYPSEKYGYIIPKSNAPVSAVSKFKGKPDVETAKRYIAEGALWNGGVFAFKLGYILERAHELIDFVDYQDLYDKFDTVEKISFDHAIAAREMNSEVIRFNGHWQDLGTWNTLTEAMKENAIGHAMMNEHCSNVHIINELDVPIVALGLHDVVISASSEGILVSDKEQSSRIKPIVDRMDQRIMFAEKSWGSFHVMDVEKDSMTIKITLTAGHSMNYHSHKQRDEVWVIISGRGRTIVDGMEQPIHSGDVITMQAGCRHSIIADTDIKLVEVQLGKEISVYDKQKYQLER